MFAPKITSVEPMMVVAGEQNAVRVTGSGFAPNCVVDVCGEVALVGYRRLNDTTVTLTVEGIGLDAELASISVTNPSGDSVTAKDCLESWERYVGN